VETAADGVAALELYRSARERGEPFHLVMLDLTVPGGMGGMETLGKLREIDPAVRAIVSSGYSDEMAIGEYRAHGFVGMIPKPYRIDDCARILGEVLAHPVAAER
jgi:CheY-like chemotaxis protein